MISATPILTVTDIYQAHSKSRKEEKSILAFRTAPNIGVYLFVMTDGRVLLCTLLII
jgi:hypothetical protein